ncbi:hypothetical protein JCM33374_g5112 [Metschnikowia sp. JCM 33374]|nr:hypothetical protein JCM33374_g5112 [Metschnikowia sp. JCM 33374]
MVTNIFENVDPEGEVDDISSSTQVVSNAAGGPERPNTAGGPERPNAAGGPESPNAGGRPENPNAGGGPESPNAGGRPESPNAGGRPVSPNAGGRPVSPNAGGRPVSPNAGGRPVSPNAGGRSVSPNAGGRPESPNAGGRQQKSSSAGPQETTTPGDGQEIPTPAGRQRKLRSAGRQRKPHSAGWQHKPRSAGWQEKPLSAGWQEKPFSAGWQQIPNAEDTFENIEESVLGLVMDDVDNLGSINLGVLSKKSRTPVVVQLYHTVGVGDKTAFPELANKTARPGTVVSEANLGELIYTLNKSPPRADLIKYIIVYEPLSAFHHKNSKGSPIVVQMKLQLDSEKGRPTFKDIMDFLAEREKKAHFINQDQHPLLSKLIEVKLIYSGPDQDPRDFEGLAYHLIEHGGHQNLHKLDIETRHYDRKNVGGHDEVGPFKKHPNWESFFLPFQKKGLKLNLFALRIDGEFRDSNLDTLALSCEALDLTRLTTLVINYTSYERSLKGLHYGAGAHTFLDIITRRSPQLRSIFITHTGVCYKCEFDALNRVLQENIPEQVDEFHFTIAEPRVPDLIKDPDPDSDLQLELQRVKNTLITHQSSMKKLKLSFGSFDPINWEPEAIAALQQVRLEIFVAKRSARVMSPAIVDFTEAHPAISEEALRTIMLYREEILQVLRSDIIFISARERLPHLTEYWVAEIPINIKNLGLLLNGELIPLEE